MVREFTDLEQREVLLQWISALNQTVYEMKCERDLPIKQFNRSFQKSLTDCIRIENDKRRSDKNKPIDTDESQHMLHALANFPQV